MRVTYTPAAIADLNDLADYLSPRSKTGAASVERRIREIVKLLSEFPGSGRPLDQRPSVRVMPLGRYPYLIFYTATADELTILHIRHGARKPIEPDEI